jgi:hypothetical protein
VSAYCLLPAASIRQPAILTLDRFRTFPSTPKRRPILLLLASFLVELLESILDLVKLRRIDLEGALVRRGRKIYF